MYLMRILLNKLRALVLPFIALLCLGYLGYHTVHGDRGLQAWIGLSDRLDALKRERADLQAQHSWLRHKASLLQQDRPDADMLDEALRRSLYLGRRDEIVIRYREPLPSD
ncbi:MAG: septum formation initiator family protein [Rhodospirillaceae bacterium]|nr:septum formation initiator family protein [Rhodospirillaceae bacterium]MDE0617367.1 septum formation initiator family protein [Rhodospirillaceae bacterium]MXY41127.1 septum formation initiator family protein [Rhodospirillaceae bacterium]MYF85892.1 septum formation initiator family protein [Rhodospirillaceae bacterium]MYH38701.1 septum formation initiator family protein [Rhodospirillaceae bacterium]